MKKFLCLLLIIAMVGVPLVACGPSEKPPVSGDDGTKAPDGTGNDAKDTPDLPDKTFGGDTFNILTDKAQKWGYYPMDVDEIDETDAYANAIHNRNALVEDRLQIEIVGEEGDGAGNVTTKFNTDVNSQANNYDAVFNTVAESLSSVAAGNVLAFDQIDHVDLTKDYWNHDCTEQLKLADRSYLNSGDIMISDKEVIWAMYFIKDRIKQAGLESPYTLVENNQWTWEKMMEMADAVDEDANADDVMSINGSDIFGLCTHYENYAASWESAGLKTVETGEDGMPYLAWGEDEFYTVHQDIQEIMNNKQVVSPSDIDFISTAISKNKTLFGTEVIAFVRSYRQSENEFGIVPYPKYKSNIERYNSYVALNSAVVEVGYSNPETDYIGIVLETMAWLGRDHLIPDYYDKQLKGRYSSDKDSSGMLDIIFEYRCYDLGVFYKDWGFSWLTASDSNSATKWAEQGSKQTNNMNRTLNKILNK